MESRDTNPSGLVPHPCVVELRKVLQSVLGENFTRLYHYGSRIEHRADPESDYDLLCVTKFPLSREEKRRILDRQLDIQLSYGVVFDLHFRDGRQVDAASPLYSPFVARVLSEGIVV